jgi:hypothetical protein
MFFVYGDYDVYTISADTFAVANDAGIDRLIYVGF